MEVFTDAALQTIRQLLRIVPVLALSMIGFDILSRLGLMKKLEPLGRPVTRASNLPPAAGVVFMTSFGTVLGANAMLAKYHEKGLINDKQLVLTALLNGVPFMFRETFTYHLPIVLPMYGLRICLVYIALFWIIGIVRLAYVIIRGKRELEPCLIQPGSDAAENNEPEDPERKSIKTILVESLHANKRILTKMVLIYSSVSIIVQLMIGTSLMHSIETGLKPVAALLSLPGAVVGPVAIFAFHPFSGHSVISNLLQTGVLTEYQAMVTVLLGGFLMVPIFRLRSTLPNYSSIFGMKLGGRIVLIGVVLALATRAAVLAIVVLLRNPIFGS